jgi:hypothetical protein
VATTKTVKYYVVDAAGNASAIGTTAVNIDTTAPTNSITLNTVSGNAVKSGNTVYYRGASAGSFTLTNAVADAASGPASSATAALGGTTTGWTHTPSTVSTPAAGPFVSNSFAWGAATTSSPTEVLTGADAAANTTAATALTFTNDNTGPTGGTVDATGLVGTGSRYSTSTGVSVAFSAGTDTAGLGSSGNLLKRATATLTNGSCGGYGAYATIATDPASSPYADTVADGACYKYQYVAVDALTNSSTSTSGDVKVDTTAPSAGTVSYTNGVFTAESVSVTFTAGADGTSGLASASHVLQRADATFNGTSCNASYSAFATIATAPASPYADTTVVDQNCYKYRYLTANNTAATTAATSANVATVDIPPCAAAPSVITSSADNTLTESAPNSNYGSNNIAQVYYNGNRGRTLVKFTLPAVPAFCTLTAASVSLYTSSGLVSTAGSRTFRLYRAASSWTEGGSTWNTQPSTTGTPATATPNETTNAATTWNVLSIVQADYAGTNNGWLIRDSTELSAYQHEFYSSEYTTASKRPQLTLTWG